MWLVRTAARPHPARTTIDRSGLLRMRDFFSLCCFSLNFETAMNVAQRVPHSSALSNACAL